MKKIFVPIFAVFMVLAGSLAAHADHFRGRIWIGPGWGPGWYDRPYYYPYPYVVEQPTVIVQPSEAYSQPAPQQPAPADSYWYYCRNPQGYFPYVKSCPEGWMKVVPTPPQPPEGR
jgi:hypothetical protein